MKFIRGFTQSTVGEIKEQWFNMALIRGYRITDVHINKTGKTLEPVLLLDMGSDGSDLAKYVDATKPMEFKDAEDVFKGFVVEQKEIKRGRPPKGREHSHHPAL